MGQNSERQILREAGAGRRGGQSRYRRCARTPKAPPAGGLGSTSGQPAGGGKATARSLQLAFAPSESCGVPCTIRTTVLARRVPRAGIPAVAALRGPGEVAQPHPGLCPAGGGDAELEAAQLLPPPKEGSSATLGEAGEPSGGGGAAARTPGAASLTPARSPQSCARLRFVVRSLADAQAVLSRLPSPERFPGTGPTLELLAAARRDVGACVSAARAPRPSGPPSSLCAPGPPAQAYRLGQSVPQPRFARSRCPPIRALVRGWEGHGQSPRDTGFFAVSMSLVLPLQLELVRPGSWRKSLRPPRRRSQTRRAVSGAGGGAVRLQGGPCEVETGWELRL